MAYDTAAAGGGSVGEKGSSQWMQNHVRLGLGASACSSEAATQKEAGRKGSQLSAPTASVEAAIKMRHADGRCCKSDEVTLGGANNGEVGWER